MTAPAGQPRPVRSTGWTLLAAVPGWLFAAWQAIAVWPFFSDDSFISLRYAARLLAGHGLTFTDGERVEGYSNLLWVLATAALGALGVDLVTAARLLGAVCTAAALWWLAKSLRPRDLPTALVASLGPLLAAASQPVLAWTLGGLEGPMVMAGLAWAYAALSVRAAETPIAHWPNGTLVRCSVPLALVCLCRPDGPLWVAWIAAGLLLANLRRGIGNAVRASFVFAVLPIVAVLGQLAFRLAYYGDWLPNTAHVKAEFDPRALPAGLAYVKGAFAVMPGLATLAAFGAIALLAQRRHRITAVLLVVPTLAWFGYLAAIGGDHFPGRRLVHAAIVPLVLLGAGGLRTLARRWPRTGLALVLGLVAVAADTWRARRDPQTAELRSEVWEWRGEALGEVLHDAFAARQPLLAVDAAGALPFYSGLPTLDLLGLCDRTIATTPLAEWLQTVRQGTPLPPGHLRGNGRYAMGRAPDLLLFSSPPGLPLPVFVSAAEFESDPRFLECYRCVLVDTGLRLLRTGAVEALVAPLWVRVDGRVGVQRQGDRIEIPAWLCGAYALPEPLIRRHQPPTGDAATEARIAGHLASAVQWYGERGAVAVPQADGSLQLELRQTTPAKLTLAIPRGDWRAQIEPATAPVELRIDGQLPAGEQFAINGDTNHEIALVPRPMTERQPVRVARIVLVRAKDR